jgi:hypothetical protein
MSVRMTFAAGLLTGLWFGMAQAAEPEGPPPPPQGPPGFGPGPGLPPPLREADTNKDGRVTHAEVDATIATRFKKGDANGDDRLDEKEFIGAMPKAPERPAPPEGAPRPPEGRPPFPPFDPAARFRATDWNGDGKLSPDEFAVPLKAMAIHADRNGDGAIAEDEMRGPPHGPHGPRPPH